MNSRSFKKVGNPEYCQLLCDGYQFFGLSSGNECRCGNKFATKPKYSKVDDAECGIYGMGSSNKNSVLLIKFYIV